MKKRAFLAPVALSVAALVANVAEPDKALAADPFMKSSVGIAARTLGQVSGQNFILSRNETSPSHFGHSSHASHSSHSSHVSHSSHSSHSSHYSGSEPVPSVDTSTYAPAPVYVPPPTPTPKPKHKRPKVKRTPRPR